MLVSTQPIRVIVVDDHEIVRQGLVEVLASFDDIVVVTQANDGIYAVSMCQQHQPDVVLMDIRMPRQNGIEATRLIRASCPHTRVVALTSSMDETELQTMLEAGAISYLLKNVTGTELASAIRAACIGQSTLAPEAAQSLIYLTTHRDTILPGGDLTEREVDVLRLLVKGLSNREIGEQLVISASTVKNHVSSILSKLGTGSRTQAVALAVKRKILLV